VAPPPRVFVRTLSMEEGRKLQRITRTAKDPVKLRRAIVVMMSAQGQSVPDITSLMQVSDDYVRDVSVSRHPRNTAALHPCQEIRASCIVFIIRVGLSEAITPVVRP
jgi:hypothetical protein